MAGTNVKKFNDSGFRDPQVTWYPTWTLRSLPHEVFLTINKERHYLWRAVDQEGNVLDILVQRRRNKQAAKKFFRKLLKGLLYVPRVITTDKLKSYGAAKREILPGVEPRQHRYLNNRAENSHQPPASENNACSGSSLLGPRNGFSRRMVLLPNTFDLGAIVLLRPHTVKQCGKDSRCGVRSQVQ